MKKALLLFAIIGLAGMVGGCSNGCGCDPDPCCEPVYASPCCPAPGGAAAPAEGGGSCGGGSCGGGSCG